MPSRSFSTPTPLPPVFAGAPTVLRRLRPYIVAMRTLLAVGIAVVMLFAGYQALGMQAAQVEDAATTNGTNQSEAAWNMSNQIFEGSGEALAPALVWMGVAAVVLVSLGILAGAYQGGR